MLLREGANFQTTTAAHPRSRVPSVAMSDRAWQQFANEINGRFEKTGVTSRKVVSQCTILINC